MLGVLKLVGSGIGALFGKKIPILGDVVGMVSDHFQNKRDLKNAIELAKIERINKLDTADITIDRITTEGLNKSWKDDFWTYLFGGSLIGVFIPGLQEYIVIGFTILENDVPGWYVAFVGISVSASFGYRELMKPFIQKKLGANNGQSKIN